MKHAHADECSLILDATTHQEAVVLRMTQELRLSDAPELRAALAQHYETSGVPGLVLDLSETAFVDSGALSVMIVTARLTKSNGGWLAIANAHDAVSESLRILKLDQVFKMFADVESALRQAAEPPREDA